MRAIAAYAASLSGYGASESAISKYGAQSRLIGIGRFVAAQKIDQRRLAATSQGKW